MQMSSSFFSNRQSWEFNFKLYHMYFGDLVSFLGGLSVGLVITFFRTVSLKEELNEHRARRRHRSANNYEGLPTIADAKLEFLQKRSFNMLTRLQGIIGITDILLATHKNEIDPKDLKIISEGARQIHSLLSEGLSLHTNTEDITNGDSAATEKVNSRKILLVEDDEMMRITCCEMLKALGLEFEVVNNGKDCIEKVKNSNFGLIIMDCEMPVMNGYEATLAIRGMAGDKKSVSIIGFTANAIRGADKKCLAAGMSSYISKPIHLNELRSAITKFIPLDTN